MASGDAKAVETFYRRYFDALYAHARRSTGRDESFCLDVVQDAVLRVIRSVRPAATEAQFAAWLRLVVQTTAYDLLRGESRREKRELVMASVSSEIDSAQEHIPDSDWLEWLAGQIALMDPQIVRIIDMRFQQRWTLAQIAGKLGLSIGAVDGRLRRAAPGFAPKGGKTR